MDYYCKGPLFGKVLKFMAECIVAFKTSDSRYYLAFLFTGSKFVFYEPLIQATSSN